MISPAVTSASEPVHASGADDIESGLFQILRKYLKQEDAAWSAETTMEEAQIDSLDLVEVVFEIEDRFGVEINFNANEKPADKMTFGDLVALIQSALAAKGAVAAKASVAAEARLA